MKIIQYIFYFIAIMMCANAITFSWEHTRLSTDPHDSLLFDGDNYSTYYKNSGYYDCYWKVVKLRGYAYGTVRKVEVGNICGVMDTSYYSEDDTLKEGDILEDGTLVETGQDAIISVAVFMKSEPNRTGRFFLTGHPLTLTKLFRLDDACNQLKAEKDERDRNRIIIIKGKVTYDSPPSEKVKALTEGKRSTVKHSKTRYSHEVVTTGGDTVDVIRVYEGAVEITHTRKDFQNEEDKTEEMNRLTREYQEGKITIDELMKKVDEFTNNAKQLSENLKPFTVEEGNKCILGKISFKIEPLGTGDEDGAR